MRILLVSTLKRRIGPDIFASRSRIIFQLGKLLAERGHSVSLLGTGDSEIPGVTIIPVIDKGWVDLPPVENSFIRDTANLIHQAQMMVERQTEFDVIHNHTTPDFFPHILEKELTIPLVTTMHAVYDKTYLDQTMSAFHNSYFSALSEAYTKQFQDTKFAGVVYNGVDTNIYTYSDAKEDYLLWLGRLPKARNEDRSFMDPKGVRHAIALAQKTDAPLKLYGVVEDREFFDRDVAPHLNDKIQWVGDVSSEQSLPIETVVSLMQHAKAFLMTVNQPENFGLVMAEAGSCGTPVIGFKRGSVPEVIEDGKTGFVVDPEQGIEGLDDAYAKISTILPEDCRKRIEEKFSIEKMIDGYVELYERLIKEFADRR
jgi:glycosyltransferase involved in cell wall biosynthesis